MTERYQGDLTGYMNAEQRLFAECVRRAAQGGDSIFPLRVKIDVNVPFLAHDGRGPMIVDASINVDLSLPIMAETDELVIRTWSVKDGDASSAQCKETPVFVRDGFSMGIDRGQSAGVAIPDYLRAVAARWLESDIERAMRAPGPTRENLAAAGESVENELHNVTVHVGDIGTAVLARKQEVPRYVLVADPIMGPTHHFGLALGTAANTGWMYGWMRELLSFPLGDYRQADTVRSALVAKHCPAHGDFGYDWTDARLWDGTEFVDHHDGLLRLDAKDDALRLAIFEFGRDLGLAMPSGSESRRDILDAVRQSPDESDVIEACDLAQNEHPEVYKAFLETAGWDFAFDPLEMIVLKRQYEMGLPLHDGPSPVSPTPGF